ncbi:hypothetical protein UM181_00930 [Alphaproteobacteria bacterium US3C007]|nr:hypothetical protein UM181_00930 [Alphaproteobacteria bacterium US3C007]
MLIAITTFAIFAPGVYFCLIRSNDASALSANSQRLTFFFQFIPIIFGIVAIGVFDIELWQGLHSKISDNTRFIVTVQSIFTLYAMLFILKINHRNFKNIDTVFIQKRNYRFFKVSKFVVISLSIIILCMVFELYRIPSYPLIIALTEGPVAGAIARGEVINYQIKNGIPLFGYILYFAPTIFLVWLMYFYYQKGVKILFWFYLGVYVLFNSIILSKSIFLVPLLLIAWVRYTVLKLKIDILFLMLILLSILTMFYLVAQSNLMDILENILRRVFIGQSMGMFLIREYFTEQDMNALFYGFPLHRLFGVESFDPSALVVEKIFGAEVDGFVNINSFFVGQGFVMVGNAIIIIGPLIYFLNIWMIFQISKFFKRTTSNNLQSVIVLYFVLTLPINTNFALLLYLKPVLGFVLVSLFFETCAYFSGESKLISKADCR